MADQVPAWIDLLYPSGYGVSSFLPLCASGSGALEDLMPGDAPPRVRGWAAGKGSGHDVIERYGKLPDGPHESPERLVAEIARDTFAGAVNWRSPLLQYNLGAAVNTAAAAIYALALDLNIYLINDGLAGDAVYGEQAVGRILADLAKTSSDESQSVFVFGGTGTVAYAMKAGLRKALPDSGATGLRVPVRIAVTEDAHFSHATAADWLGVGTEGLIEIPALADRRSDLDAAARLLNDALAAGYALPALVVNGGTTYDHTVDDIAAWAALRDRLVVDHALEYVPHLHVDSVVGWIWLVFNDYDFDTNPLGIGAPALATIREQHRRISAVGSADSWGVDFHKGLGGCPVDSSVITFRDRVDLARVGKGNGPLAQLHQLAEEFSTTSPVDYTLETSRAGGKALAALAALHSAGRDGYRHILARMMERVLLFRELIAATDDIALLNGHALGYQTMIRLYAPEAARDPRRGAELRAADPSMAEFVTAGNRYLKAFFAWDNETRMNAGGDGFVYSFSSKYVQTPSGLAVSGLKIYPATPRVTATHMREAVVLLQRRKAEFDRIWEAAA